MNARLIEPFPESFSGSPDINAIFTKAENDAIRRSYESREQPKLGVPKASCVTNLFFGFFFDGTKNNYVQAEIPKNHSNVARLYDCFPGLSVEGVLPTTTDWVYKENRSRYSHFFKVYVPGVASPFKEVNDSGEGKEQTAGAAAGYKGEARIIWALIQAINNIHRYFLKVPLLNSRETLYFVNRIVLGRDELRFMSPVRRPFQAKIPNEDVLEKTRLEFEKILIRLHSAIGLHMPDKNGKPKKTDPGSVQKIFISTFGFSRGATQARAFTNWLMGICALDARLCRKEGLTLGGFKVEFSFLGLFDTVASVGAGNTLGNSILGKLFDGHGAWSDAEKSLRIPPGLRCVHLVAAHEIRRSFPLDSISVKQVLPENSEEIVVPGVHSDLGCGYTPQEQGRGFDKEGADMLTRVPLLYMYRKARLAGVPLKLELANKIAQDRFKIVPETIRALNAYLATCKIKSGKLTDIMREQGMKNILWHKARRQSGKSPIESSASFIRASNFDKNDLQSANQEFEQEVKEFETWIAKKGKGFRPKSQEPGFDNGHENEWQEISTWWNTEPIPSPEVLNFFDNYVHDSRAWFKLIPGNPDNETDLIKKLKEWRKRTKQAQQYAETEEKIIAEKHVMMGLVYRRNSSAGTQPPRPLRDGLSDEERKLAEEFERTGKIPRMRTVGREPFDSSWDSYGHLVIHNSPSGSDIAGKSVYIQ